MDLLQLHANHYSELSPPLVQTVGVAYGDAVLQKLTVAEFPDDEHFSNLSVSLFPRIIFDPFNIL